MQKRIKIDDIVKYELAVDDKVIIDIKRLIRTNSHIKPYGVGAYNLGTFYDEPDVPDSKYEISSRSIVGSTLLGMRENETTRFHNNGKSFRITIISINAESFKTIEKISNNLSKNQITEESNIESKQKRQEETILKTLEEFPASSGIKDPLNLEVVTALGDPSFIELNHYNSYINIIDGMDTSSTYKLAWGLGILECLLLR